MTPREFETLLDQAISSLAVRIQTQEICRDARTFERWVCDSLRDASVGKGVNASPTFHPHAFPDIAVNGFGVEVKYTTKNSWLAVGNSIFEGMRAPGVDHVYVVFGKMGGWPEVRWKRYEDCVTHVRISHAPRFVLEMDRQSPLFEIMQIPYAEFRELPPEEKMTHVRDYSRSRLREGERLWWLEDREDQDHTLPIQVRLYMRLGQDEKRRLRAEAAILCPQIVKPSRTRNKYTDAALYLLTQHGVFCPQTRDLFTAGSVALRSDETRGGNYVLRALKDIELEMRGAAERLDQKLFVEYWGASFPPELRLREWLRRADSYARDWRPSDHLFLSEQR